MKSIEQFDPNNQAQISLFNFEGHTVRAAVKDGEPLFCIADICAALEVSNTGNVAASLREKDTVHTVDGIVSEKNVPLNMTNEKGVYRIIFKSRKPEAERFQDWVFDVVLPEIRKTGGFNLPQLPNFDDPVEAARAWADEREGRQLAEARALDYAKQNQELESEVETWHVIKQDEHERSAEDVAKLLGLGRNTFLRLLREHGVLSTKSKNRMMQYYINAGWGSCKYNLEYFTFTTVFTPKGVHEIRKLLGIYPTMKQIALDFTNA